MYCVSITKNKMYQIFILIPHNLFKLTTVQIDMLAFNNFILHKTIKSEKQ